MKRILLFIAISIITCGGSIDYLSQESADYLRGLTRNATTDSADAVHYNPAGTAFMEDGFHLSLSSITIFKDYTVIATAPADINPLTGEGPKTEYNTSKPSKVVPSLYGVWKKGKIGFFGGIDVPAGGGSLDYKDGVFAMAALETGRQNALKGISDPTAYRYVASMQDGRFEGSSVFIGGTAGISYQLNEMYSFSLAGRYISAEKTYEGKGSFAVVDGATGSIIGTSTGKLDAEKTASGIGGIIGMHIRPTENVNIGLRYETKTELEFETEASGVDPTEDWSVLPQLESYRDGHKENKDLPALFAGGISYDYSENFKLNFGATYYFIEDADGTEDSVYTAVEYNDNYENGWEASTGFEYMATENLLFSAGYQYTKVGGNEDTYNDFEYKLDSHLYGIGGKYMITENSDISLGLAHVVYVDGEGSGIYNEVDYEKSATVIGIGFNTKK